MTAGALVLPIVTERLTLRDFEPLDWYAVHAFAGDPETMRFMFYGPRDEADARAYVARMLAAQHAVPRTVWELAIARRADDVVVGACDLTLEENGVADLGYLIGREAWGQGIATEAARAMVAAGFRGLGLDRIEATCDVEHAASARVLEKAGLVRERRLERHKLARGRWWSSWRYGVSAAAWAAAQSSSQQTSRP